jgi:hypothetical protein
MSQPHGGEWHNFENWLSGPLGWTFYLGLVFMISLIPVLVVFRRLYFKGALHSFPAFWIWVGFGLLPGLALIASYAAVSLGGFVLISGVPLIAGSVIMLNRRFERLAAFLLWIGLGLTPVMLGLLMDWVNTPSVAVTFVSIFATPLFVGLIASQLGRGRQLLSQRDRATCRLEGHRLREKFASTLP